MSVQTSKKPAPGVSGSICPKTGLYKATDGKIEFVVQVEKGKPFPKFPGGSGTSNATWTALGAADGERNSFEAVKVAAGTM